MTTSITTNPKSTTQPRGRPRVTGDDLTARQVPVLAAAGRLLATRQSTDISVELLLQETGTSRPTFYRWFPNGMSQVFDLLIAKANTDLMVRIISAISRCDNFDERIHAGIKAYFDWGWAQGPVVSGIYREGFTEGSIAQRYRRQTLDVVIGMINQQAEMLGQNALPPRMIETLVSWVESAGAVVFRQYPVKQSDVEQQCELTIQMFLATVSVVLKDHGIALR